MNTEESRKEFEGWAELNCYILDLDEDGDYENDLTFSAFEGYQAAKAQPQWIPVSERMPEHKDGWWSDPVIAMTDTGNIYRLSYCGGWQRTSEFVASGSSKVTHWMPLPSAPVQAKDGE